MGAFHSPASIKKGSPLRERASLYSSTRDLSTTQRGVDGGDPGAEHPRVGRAPTCGREVGSRHRAIARAPVASSERVACDPEGPPRGRPRSGRRAPRSLGEPSARVAFRPDTNTACTFNRAVAPGGTKAPRRELLPKEPASEEAVRTGVRARETNLAGVRPMLYGHGDGRSHPAARSMGRAGASPHGHSRRGGTRSYRPGEPSGNRDPVSGLASPAARKTSCSLENAVASRSAPAAGRTAPCPQALGPSKGAPRKLSSRSPFGNIHMSTPFIHTTPHAPRPHHARPKNQVS